MVDFEKLRKERAVRKEIEHYRLLIAEMLLILKEMEFGGVADIRGRRCHGCLFSEQPSGYEKERHHEDCSIAAVIAEVEVMLNG